jgi:predicted CXXCH cytochrome family protein
MNRLERGFRVRLSGKSAVFLLSILTILLFSSGAATRAQVTTEHPFIKPQEIKSGTCLICHPDKEEGKYVHSAVAAGCQNCHQVTSKNSATTIVLLATGGELCNMCHEMKSDPVLHGPYRNGQCMICHNPHTSNFPRQLRADPNTLCLSCHGVNRPDVKIDKEVQKVSMLGNQTLRLAEYRQAPKLGLDSTGTRNHPVMGHPIVGEDPRHKDTPLTCLSCHAPHSSTLANLLPPNVKNSTELCEECHP